MSAKDIRCKKMFGGKSNQCSINEMEQAFVRLIELFLFLEAIIQCMAVWTPLRDMLLNLTNGLRPE
jgi:hypothetical protein